MLFHKNGRLAGLVTWIGPAWNNGPDQIRCSTEFENVGTIRWLQHALDDGMVLVCPD